MTLNKTLKEKSSENNYSNDNYNYYSNTIKRVLHFLFFQFRTSFFKTRAADSVIVVFGFGAVKFIFGDATGAVWVVLVVVGAPTKIGTPKIIVLQTCLYYMFSSFCFLPIFDDAIIKVLLLYNK